MRDSVNIRKISFAGVIAALYVALVLVGAMVSFGPLQFRFAEVLTVLPFFFPIAVPGLFVGCIIANLFSPYGLIDVVVGSLASLFAGLCTMKIGMVCNRERLGSKLLACLPPVIFNAIMIGAMISWLVVSAGAGYGFLTTFVIYGAYVGLGQLGVLYLLGMPLMIYMTKSGMYNRLSALMGETLNSTQVSR
ncbi:MAG: QueT transporter family protein [Oscillospiraceae bacterium]|nr:QueT transporter family protein [Oscillospiraceae bacterium]